MDYDTSKNARCELTKGADLTVPETVPENTGKAATGTMNIAAHDGSPQRAPVARIPSAVTVVVQNPAERQGLDYDL